MYMMRIIGHLDMDAFFAAIEEREHEWLRGKPIVVGADPKEGRGRGVVSTANYKAREYGIRSALPISKAWELSESARKKGLEPAVFLFTNFAEYENTSARIMEILKKFSNTIEQASIDEAYFDIKIPNSKSQITNAAWKEAETIAKKIKTEIKKRERLTCSIGIGPNKLMGKWGRELYQKVRGIDDSPLETVSEPKSIGEQETFLEDTRSPDILIAKLNEMSERILQRMEREGFSGFRTIAITVRFAGFETHTRAHTLSAASGSLDTLRFEALKLFMPFLDRRENPRDKKIRLVGVRIEKLKSAGF